jgi:beta-glucosidase/6-phospho-beta-glucosidase/beta-galactosidase
MKTSTSTEDADVGSFFAIVLGTLLVAFVLPQLASRMWTPKKKQVEIATSSMIEMRMAEREMYRYNKNATTPSVFAPYEQTEDDGDEYDFDDEITVQSFLEVHKEGDFPKFRKEEEEEEEEEEVEKEEEEEITSSASNWRCACEEGFLPPGLLKSFGGAEAVIKMVSGQCYHKQA